MTSKISRYFCPGSVALILALVQKSRPAERNLIMFYFQEVTQVFTEFGDPSSILE